jgi:hypothetical protein
VPITPSELAQDGRSAIDAGAVALHIHPRASDGGETLTPEHIAAALTAVRAACPGIPIEVSTAAWIEGDVARRLARVRSWTELPDSAGVNFGEPGAAELATTLLARGIGVEAGLFSAADAQVQQDRATKTATLLTLPLLGWVANAVSYAGNHPCSYPASYNPQDDHDPYHSSCGNGRRNAACISRAPLATCTSCRSRTTISMW